MAVAAAVQTLMGPNYLDCKWDCTHALALTGYYDAVFGGAEASEGAAPTTPAGNGTPVVRVQLKQVHATANQSGSFRDTMHFALRGLPPDYDVITNPLLTQRLQDVTFAAVLPKLQMQEQILQGRRSANVAISAHSRPAGRGRSSNRGRGRGRGRGLSTSSSPMDMSRRVCYNCGEPGHYQADCPRPQRTNGSHTPAARSHGAHRASTPPARSSSPSSSPVHRVHLTSSSRTLAFTGVCGAATDQLQGMWLIDSACSKHITPRDELLHDHQLLQPPHQILCANSSVMATQGQGTVRFKREDGEFQLQHVLYVPGASSSLLSLGQAVRAGIMPKFSKAGCQLTAPHMAPLTSKLQGDLFVIDQQPIPVLDSHGSLCMAARMALSPLLWDYRFAHSSCRRLANMVRHNMVLGIDVSAAKFERHDSSNTLCEPCIMGKQHSLYYVSLLDDYSTLLAVTLIKQKSDAAAAIIDMVIALERQTGSKLKALTSRSRTVTLAVQRHVTNTPWEVAFMVKPDVAHLRVWGAPAYIHEPDHLRRKLDSKAGKGIFVGYEVGCKSFRVLVESWWRVSKSVVVDEAAVLPRTAPAAAVDDEPEAPAEVPAPLPWVQPVGEQVLVPVGALQVQQQAVVVQPPLTRQQQGQPTRFQQHHQLRAVTQSAQRQQLRQQPRNPTTCAPGPQSSAKHDSSGGSNNSSIDPQSFEEAMARSDAADWLRAMNKEMACKQANQTWQLVKQQGWMRVLSGRWVFKTKRGGDGSILEHKTRLVIIGYRHVEGVDFDDSFALVVT
ncbi:hypothetical protein QJQ45_030205 [Haematococcus lacustris]|nr:hypothetical protein QJQ45_030205 [Haematococcus lacustris]